ncbi:hypothetical protein QBC43DRAFT_315316 [Cladorrhinum sp. PSN259]|nr:hypothetical protein QBC43DRAFT_315316 [Cladorrhinum sp. PSN259]
MFRSRSIRLALAGLVLLLSFAGLAESTNDFKFSECITNCIRPSSCPPSKSGNLNGKCMCKAASEGFLESVLACMSIYCKPDLRGFDDKFLDPMEDGCDDINHEIPKSKIKAAESVGSSLLSNLPTATTATPLMTSTNSKTVITSSSSKTTTLQTTTLVREPSSSSAATETTTAPPSQSPSPSTQAPPSPRTTSASSGSDFVDTSPFTNARSTGSQSHVLFTLLVAVPFAVIGFVWS